MQTIGRLAPSPTGGLHVGHARTFLIAWLESRSRGGRIILRIEDIDASRVRLEATEDAIQDLRWLGLDWDEGPDLGGPSSPYLQSQRRDQYDSALEVLKSKELIYPCTCTRADIARAASAPHADDDGPIYPGTCSGRLATHAKQLADQPFCWRFRVTSKVLAWNDLVRGEIAINPVTTGGDFVVGRSSGEPSYQLAVVCDDAAMGVNQVIRGDDLVSSTPKQISLYQALGWPEPTFGHVPLVLGSDGRRLAKRDGAIKLATLRESGMDSSQLIAVIASSLGVEGVPSEIRPNELVRRFDLTKLPTSLWVFDPAPVPCIRYGIQSFKRDRKNG